MKALEVSQKLYNHCLRKRAYVSWGEADRAARNTRSDTSFRLGKGPLLAYKCMYHNHWHIGRARPRRGKWRR